MATVACLIDSAGQTRIACFIRTAGFVDTRQDAMPYARTGADRSSDGPLDARH
jgi:hypothetical protein